MSWRASADFFRAAVFGWTTPFETALSRIRIASCTDAGAAGALACTASRAAFTTVRMRDRIARFRSRRRSFCLIRFFADLILATSRNGTLARAACQGICARDAP